MRGVSLLVVSLLGVTAHSPDRDSLRGQLHPASTDSSAPRSSRPTLIGSKVTCKGGTAPSLRTIDVRTWEEGISSSRVSLAELLTLAHMINATLIEPCMHDGHLIACDGNCGRALADVGKLTFEQLEAFGIPYDEVVFGKPHADVYVDRNVASSLDGALLGCTPLMSQPSRPISRVPASETARIDLSSGVLRAPRPLT